MLELAVAYLKTSVEELGVETYETLCKDWNINKKDLALVTINWSQICSFSISFDPLIMYQNIFFPDPSQYLKFHIM